MGASDFAMLRPIELKSQSFINGQGIFLISPFVNYNRLFHYKHYANI